MKRLFKNGLEFVTDNRTIISSLLLIFVVVGALFLNTYVTLNRFQENFDKTLQSKAIMAGNIIQVAATDEIDNINNDSLKEKLKKIKEGDEEIIELKMFAMQEDGSLVDIFLDQKNPAEDARTEQSKISEDDAKSFASSSRHAIAYLDSENGVRNWSVMKSVRNKQDEVKGVLLMRLSLADSDALMEKSIMQVYLFSIAAMFVVLLLIFNHLRLFTFEVKARKLEEIDKMKDDFISMASHELKTPLTAISGYAELLTDSFSQKASVEMDTARRKYTGNITKSVERLNILVEDLLDVSRLEQNRVPFDLKPMDIAATVAGICQEMSVTAQQKNLELINSADKLSFVIADQERVKQILINLIGNAIKYTPAGKVELQGKEDEKWVYITVADTGLGISAENLQNLFSKFYRIKTEKTAGISGTGLGLWIAREMAEKMGGALGVESIEGVGSHFMLKLKKNK